MTMADLKLAETILAANWTTKFKEAYSISKDFPISELLFNNNKFYYAQLRALLCDKLNRKEEAVEYAKIAIEFSKISEPQFDRHKSVGIVKATSSQLIKLEEIVNR